MTPQGAREWGAALTIWLGYALVVFSVVFWVFTDRKLPEAFALATLLLGVGYGGQALAQLRAPQPPPAPAADTDTDTDSDGGA